ncbi:hypothetical protein [Streptomyces sp. NPDC054865]
MNWVIDQLRGDIRFRTDVPRFDTPTAQSAYATALREAVVTVLDDPKVTDRWARSLDATHHGRPYASLPHLEVPYDHRPPGTGRSPSPNSSTAPAPTRSSPELACQPANDPGQRPEITDGAPPGGAPSAADQVPAAPGQPCAQDCSARACGSPDAPPLKMRRGHRLVSQVREPHLSLREQNPAHLRDASDHQMRRVSHVPESPLVKL